jgi:hypothetical protein
MVPKEQIPERQDGIIASDDVEPVIVDTVLTGMRLEIIKSRGPQIGHFVRDGREMHRIARIHGDKIYLDTSNDSSKQRRIIAKHLAFMETRESFCWRVDPLHSSDKNVNMHGILEGMEEQGPRIYDCMETAAGPFVQIHCVRDGHVFGRTHGGFVHVLSVRDLEPRVTEDGFCYWEQIL